MVPRLYSVFNLKAFWLSYIVFQYIGWGAQLAYCKGKLEFENHSDIDMCYGQQTVLQYANSGIRSEAEIEEKHKASQLARHHHQLQHGINKHRERVVP